MPYIIARVNTNPALAELNFSAHKASCVAVHSYQFTGLVGAPGPIFMEVRNQPFTAIVSNVNSSQFLLGNATGSTVYNDFKKPLVITEGDQRWNDSRQIQLLFTDFNGNLITLENATICFEYVPVDPHNEKGDNPEADLKMISQCVTKNNFPLPSFWSTSSNSYF